MSRYSRRGELAGCACLGESSTIGDWRKWSPPHLPAWTGTVLAILASDAAGPSNHPQRDMETTHGVRTEPLHDGARDPGPGPGGVRSHGELGHGSAQADPGPGGPADQCEHP